MFSKRATPPAQQRRRSSESSKPFSSFDVDPELMTGDILPGEGWTNSNKVVQKESIIPTSVPVQNTRTISTSNGTKSGLPPIPSDNNSSETAQTFELRTISTSHMDKFLDDMTQFSAQFESQNIESNATVSGEKIVDTSKFQEKVAMSQQKLEDALHQQKSVESSEQNTRNDLLDFYFDESILKDLDADVARGPIKTEDEDTGSLRRFLPPVTPKTTDILTLPIPSDSTLSSNGPIGIAESEFSTSTVLLSSEESVDDIFGQKIPLDTATTTATGSSIDTNAPLANDSANTSIYSDPLQMEYKQKDAGVTTIDPAQGPATKETVSPAASSLTLSLPTVKVVGAVDPRSSSPLRRAPPAETLPPSQTPSKTQAQTPGSPTTLLGQLGQSVVPKLFIRKTYDDPTSDSEDGPEEGTPRFDASAHLSAILTKVERERLTKEQKAVWKCKQDDLMVKRADFHGAVTYAFEGIFSCSMYGATEAKDTNGKPYTEYLMRCQWGTDWSNMEPWIVARRYSEFENLHNAIRDRYFSLFGALPQFPSKTLFGTLTQDTVTHRRDELEKYLSKIVTDLPTILRSEIIDLFLTITPRLGKIRENIFKAECGAAFNDEENEMITSATDRTVSVDGPTIRFEELSSLIIPARSMSSDMSNNPPNSSKKRSTSIGVSITKEVF